MTASKIKNPATAFILSVILGTLLGGASIAIHQAWETRNYPSEIMKGERTSAWAYAASGFLFGGSVGAFGGW